MNAKEQLAIIKQALDSGGYMVSGGWRSEPGARLTGKIGSLGFKVIINNLGMPCVSGRVVALRYTCDGPETGNVLATFLLSNSGLSLRNNILDYTLDRKEPFFT